MSGSNHPSVIEIGDFQVSPYFCPMCRSSVNCIFRHLARNPFHCDCRISWIVDWLSANPVETSGARCEGPKKMHKRKLSSLLEEQLKCYCKFIHFLGSCHLMLFIEINFKSKVGFKKDKKKTFFSK